MSKFRYRAAQVITDDSGDWNITKESIKQEYVIEAQSDVEAIDIGNKKLMTKHPEVPLSDFLYRASSI